MKRRAQQFLLGEGQYRRPHMIRILDGKGGGKPMATPTDQRRLSARQTA